MDSQVGRFFANKTLFITGGAGFIGKVIIEKLLRSCPEVKKIYLLLREKRGVSAEDRLKKLFQSKLFTVVIAQRPQCDQVVEVMEGDLEEERFGLSDANYKRLLKEVNVVIHSAATVSFTEKPRKAITVNLLAVRRLIQLCSSMEALNVLLHVSTAFAHCDRKFIEETIYPSSVPADQLLDAMQWLDDNMLETLFQSTKKHPNTYTFTKNLAETLLATEGKHLPIVIIRPSIVAPSLEEPYPGWIDNYNGVTGSCLAIGTGILRTLNIRYSTVADIIPVDLVVNLILALGWYHGEQKKYNKLTIYHSTSGTINPVTWGDLASQVAKSSSTKIPYECAVRMPKMIFIENSFLYKCRRIYSHLIPAYLMDAVLFISGKPRRLVRIYDKLHRTLEAQRFFFSNEWKWTHKNTDVLWKEMNDTDHKLFNFNIQSVNWHRYIDGCVLGVKTFLLNEDPSDLSKARKRLRKLRGIRWALNIVVIVVILLVIFAILA